MDIVYILSIKYNVWQVKKIVTVQVIVYIYFTQQKW